MKRTIRGGSTADISLGIGEPLAPGSYRICKTFWAYGSAGTQFTLAAEFQI